MSYIFKTCINTSIKGAILIIVILFLQKYFRKDFTSKWTYALWSLVLARLLLPFSPIKNVVSLYNLGLVKRLQFSINDVLLGRLGTTSDKFEIIKNTVSTDEFISAALSFNWYHFFIILWIIGVLILTGMLCYIGVKIHFILKNSQKCESDLLNIMYDCREKISLKRSPELYISPDISSPFTFGILSPKIIIPEATLLSLNKRNLEHIFLHELIHIKRYDVFFTTLGMIICSIHWFNPLVWIGYFRSKKDCELACDEGVLKYLTKEEYTQYSLTLIEMMNYVSKSTTHNFIVSKALIHDRAEANARVFQISNYHKKRKLAIIFSICLLIFTAIIGLNESSSTRPSMSLGKHDLSNYLHVTETEIRQTFGIKPVHSYAIKVDETSYFILYYNILGEKVQFWRNAISNDSKEILEITTTSYKNIRQGMDLDEVKRIASTQSLSLVEIQELDSILKYIYQDDNCMLMIIVDKKTNKVYSINLY